MSPSSNPTFEIDSDGIGWITFDDADRPLNVLTESIMLHLAQTLDAARPCS